MRFTFLWPYFPVLGANHRVLFTSCQSLYRSFEKLVEKAAKTSGERSVERLSERASERILSEAATKAGERTAEQSIRRQWWKNALSFFSRGAEGAGERTLERAGDRAVTRGFEAAEKSGKRLIDRGLEQSGERIAERTFERSGDRLVERGLEHSGGHLVERGLEHGSERLVERGFERSGERLVERGAKQSGERILERSTTKGPGRVLERIFGISSERIVLRLGRAILITLPVLGGIFALYLLKSDMKRLKEEWDHKFKISSALFLGAGIVDGLDSALHFFIAYALWKHLSHGRLAVAEEWSLACAIISTVFAVAGEIISIKLAQKRQRSGVKYRSESDANATEG